MASQQTPPNSAPTTPSEKSSTKLSAEDWEAVLKEVKALQDDPRTTWLKKGEAEKNAEESRATAQALEVYDRLSVRRGPVDDALNAAAEEIAAGKPANAAKQRAYEVIREVIRQTLAEGQEGRAPGSEGAAGRCENDLAEEGRGPTRQDLEDASQNGLSFSPAPSFFTREHCPVTPPRNPSDPF